MPARDGNSKRKHAHLHLDKEKTKKRKSPSDKKSGSRGQAYLKERPRTGEATHGTIVAREKAEVKWTVPSTQGMDSASVIRGYDRMTPLEKLKAKTKYLEQRYGAVEQLEKRSKELTALVDEEDDIEIIQPPPATTLSHEDAMFGSVQLPRCQDADSTRDTESPPSGLHADAEDPLCDKRGGGSQTAAVDGAVISEEIVQSQKTTSWRERAAWLRAKRKASQQTAPP